MSSAEAVNAKISPRRSVGLRSVLPPGRLRSYRRLLGPQLTDAGSCQWLLLQPDRTGYVRVTRKRCVALPEPSSKWMQARTPKHVEYRGLSAGHESAEHSRVPSNYLLLLLLLILVEKMWVASCTY